MTMTLIETKTLGAAAASIEFTSIPQTFTDLVVLISARSTASANLSAGFFTVNNTNPTERFLMTDNGTVLSGTGSTLRFDVPAATNTANTFSSSQVYIPNYASTTTNKSISVEHAFESNGSYFTLSINAALYSSTTAITSVKYSVTTLAIGSTISLYGITKGSDGIVTTS
jgi:hypothetical protein